jgi:capsid protein
MNVVVKECLKDAILNGLISAPGFFDNPMIQYAYCQGSYLGPVPGAINPVQEANANEKNVKNAFVTRSDIASLHGNEFDNMINEWGDQEKEWFDKNPEKQAEIIQGVE